ncbi:PepSY domain-containing protein [Streptomyces sp. NPDC086182]|jgi:hypothetical protein|uniref:PepSY domain-containing protein n=1 Tax=Streptomyces sp. NPDC086182 TaxID=3155058 RepID=UPI00343A7D89
MSQPVPPEPSESTPTEPSRRRLPRLPQLGRSRWLALGVGVVLLGGAVAGAAAVAEHDRGEKGDRMRVEAAPGWKGGDGGERRVLEDGRGESGFKNGESRMRRNIENGQDAETGRSGLAPAPVPAVSAAKAIEAAGKAVPGGKPDSLRVVVQQGGGSGWEVEVLGTDGVRHLVTLDGATGAVTGNTVASAGR